MPFNLQEVLRALLFASPGSLSVKDIQGVFTRFHQEAIELPGLHAEEGELGLGPVSPGEVPTLVTASQIREAMEGIRSDLEASSEVFRLQETHNGWRFVTSPGVAEWVRLLRKQPKPLKLTQSALETLSIIAYRQPVVRAEIESIRGVSADSPINRLLERDLIEITGRADLPGRPIQYGTTDAFLEFVGIRALDELPASDVLSHREIDDWLKRASEVHTVSDRELGLDTESGDEEAGIELEREGPPAEEKRDRKPGDDNPAEPRSRVTVTRLEEGEGGAERGEPGTLDHGDYSVESKLTNHPAQ